MGLQIKGLYKHFPSSDAHTLENINLEISDGEFVCVTGPSGCGKTTLLNLVAGLEKPSAGELHLDGSVITDAGADRVVMFQESALFPWLTVIDNVKFGLKLAGKSKSEQEEIAMRYLRLVQLAHYRDYRCHELSGGMKQRVALARALALESKILLMDEPFAALDKQTKNILHEEVQNIWMQTRKTIIFITHSAEEATLLSDRIIVLSANPGKIANEIRVDLPRPRQIDAPQLITLRAELLKQLRNEVMRSVGKEYDND